MNDKENRSRFAEVKRLAGAGEHATAFALLAGLVAPDDDYPTQQRAARLFAAFDKGALGLRPLRLAVLAASTTEHMTPIVAYWLARQGFAAEIWAAPFDTVAAAVLDPESPLYAFKPDVVWFMSTWRDVDLTALPGAGPADADAAVERAIRGTAEMCRAARDGSNAQFILNNADIPTDEVFGHFEAAVPWSRRNLLRRYNLGLGGAVGDGVILFDLDHLASTFGKRRWEDPRYWYHSKHAFSFDALGPAAFQFARLVAAARGLARKCLVLDLDNTLWGGVIGDDGLEGIALGTGAAGEAFVDFQRYAKALKERGIILAVCSKNDDKNAREPFQRHPDMQLRLDDVSVFCANWNNKAENIRAIAETLNIGLDSLVFVDDDPAERHLVRQFLPMVAVPEMPEDPAEYVRALQAQRYFEAVSFSDEDRKRAGFYKADALRADMRSRFADLKGYLQTLEMIGTVGEVDAFHLPRAAQLINKSNQFHLTGTRYTEAELAALAASDRHRCRVFKLRDRFGDNGLIAVVVLAADDAGDFHVDTWVMSCRVLGRGMEEFIAAELLALARDAGAARLVGRHVPSNKNGLVAGLYERLGFELSEGAPGGGKATVWRLDVAEAPGWDVAIRRDDTAPAAA